MASLINYRGLEVPSATTGAGGAAISDNFQNLADWHPLSQWAQTGNPTVNDDQTLNYFPGSLWLNSSTNELFLCINSATGAAVWQPVMRINSNGSITVPDAPGAVAGNARGAFAVDLQAQRNAATQVASGAYSAVIGYRNTASAFGGMAVGKENTASGFDSVAMGHLNISGGGGSMAMGVYSTASGTYGVAMGVSCTASGLASVAMGDSNISSGHTAVALGAGNAASGSYSMVVGGWNTSSGSYSMAVGSHNSANHNGELAFGPHGQIWQASVFSVGAQTADATQTELTTDGQAPNAYGLGVNPNTNRLLLEEKTYACTAMITARQSGGSNYGMWKRQFLVTVDTNNVGTLSTVQTIGIDVVSSGFSGVSVAVSLATNGPSGNHNALQILVTGLASTTISWAATIEATIITTD